MDRLFAPARRRSGLDAPDRLANRNAALRRKSHRYRETLQGQPTSDGIHQVARVQRRDGAPQVCSSHGDLLAEVVEGASTTVAMYTRERLENIRREASRGDDVDVGVSARVRGRQDDG